MEYALIYGVLYVGSVALLIDDWRRDFDVTLGDFAIHMLLSTFLAGWFIWPICRLSDWQSGKRPIVLLRRKGFDQ